MATQLSFVEYVAEVARLEGSLTHKRMFGEYALYLDGKVVAFACDNSLFIKASPETAALTASLPQRPPYPEAKPYPVADELLDEPERLRALLLATERAMPAPKAKTAKPRVAKSKPVTSKAVTPKPAATRAPAAKARSAAAPQTPSARKAPAVTSVAAAKKTAAGKSAPAKKTAAASKPSPASRRKA